MAIEFGRVNGPLWDDKPLAIVAGGSSLIGFDFSTLRERCHVLAVKGSIFDIPWASAGFGLDTPRLREWSGKLRDTVKMTVYWATPDELPYELQPIPCMVYLRRWRHEGLATDPAYINGGGTSGFGALNVAWHKRAKRIILYGFDYKMEGGDIRHHNQQHYIQPRKQNRKYWSGWADKFDDVAAQLKEAGVEVLNASPESAIDAFPRITLQQADALLGRA